MFSIIVYAVGTFASGLYAFRFFRVYKRKNHLYFRYLFIACSLLTFGLFTYFIFPLLQPKNSFLMELGYIIGQIFVLLSFAAITKALPFILGEDTFLLKYGPFLLFIACIIITFIHIAYFAYPWIDNYGLIHWNQSNVTKITVSLINTLFEVPIGIIFLIKRPIEIGLKIKSIFLALAFLCGGIGGQMAVVFDSSRMLALAYSLYLAGFLSLLTLFIISVKTKT